ncbi:hypothetical protein KDX14_33045 [Burkholderia cenocepacia]|uniref:hypothetical protein n=1 Tax=Burkholderia cenocepacia TaxID=95486 RepID=UPI001B9AF7D4|nr:hypothetical protein [Burkholderia cenocepacia]MBR8074353.1 hypothetical protein [Burkholderia cenocepacia]
MALSQQELQIINKGLMLVPYGEAAPVINSINAQIQTEFDKRADAAQGSADDNPK